MPRLPQFTVAFFILAIAVSAAASAQAPEGKRPGYGKKQGGQQPQIPKEDIRFEGTIKGIQGGLVHVVGEGTNEWLVKIPDRGQGMTVNGSATQEWLERGARGMMVRFVGTFDAAGKPQSAINELYVFTPRPGRGGRAGEELTPGVFPEGAGPDLKAVFSGDEVKTAPKVMDFRVVGQFAGYSKGTISVAAGRARVAAPLADDARVSVSIGDLRLARLGDKIEVDGWHLPNMPKQVYANRLTITAAAPFGEKPEQPTKEAETPAAE